MDTVGGVQELQCRAQENAPWIAATGNRELSGVLGAILGSSWILFLSLLSFIDCTSTLAITTLVGIQDIHPSHSS